MPALACSPLLTQLLPSPDWLASALVVVRSTQLAPLGLVVPSHLELLPLGRIEGLLVMAEGRVPGWVDSFQEALVGCPVSQVQSSSAPCAPHHIQLCY